MSVEPPDIIVIISVDDLRADCVDAAESTAWLEQYGVTDALITPTIDELYEEGVTFERATSASSYTPPSHASLFTGMYPSEHGVKTFFNRLEDQKTLAEALSEAGYRTVAWIENVALQMLDVTAGFDRVVCPFEEEGLNLFDTIEEVSDADQLCLFIHLFDVHKPYGYATGGEERQRYNDDYPECLDPLLPHSIQASGLLNDAREEATEVVPNYESLTEPLREYANYRSLDYLIREALKSEVGDNRFEYLVRLYIEGVTRFDRNRLTDLLDTLSAIIGEEGFLLFTSDHGETRCQWADREDFMNSFNVSEGAVRVPFVVNGTTDLLDELTDPNIPVNHVDVYPTILEAAGVEPAYHSGESLFNEPAWDRELFNESWYYSGGADFFGNVKETGEGGLSEVAVRVGNCKLIRSFAKTGTPDSVVRRLDAPIPEKTQDDPACEPFDRLFKILENFIDDVSLECSPDIGPDQQVMEDRLKALGYLE